MEASVGGDHATKMEIDDSYSNKKMKSRLQAFFTAKPLVFIRDVDVKVVFTFDQTKKLKETLHKTLTDIPNNVGVKELISKLDDWDNFGLESYSQSWKVSLFRFLTMVPKDSFLMRCLLSNETMNYLDIQCARGTKEQQEQEKKKETTQRFIPKTNLGEIIEDIIPQGDVEKQIREHISKRFYNGLKDSYQIPSFNCQEIDEVWAVYGRNPPIITISPFNNTLKLLSFIVTRNEKRMIKCHMLSPITCDKGATSNLNPILETAVSLNRYKETRYINVDFTQCYVKMTNVDLMCLVSILNKTSSQLDGDGGRNDNNGNDDDDDDEVCFTASHYVVASYLMDYLGLSTFRRGWNKKKKGEYK